MLARNLKPRTGLSNLKLLMVVPLTAACVLFFSKRSLSIEPPGEIWKKQVVRVVEFTQPEDTAAYRRHLHSPESDSLLVEMLVAGVYSGNLTAYSNYDAKFSKKLTAEQLKEEFSMKPDTVLLTDPVTGNERVKIINHDFDFSVIHKYRILEDWTYNQRTRKTEIQVVGIAPVEEVWVAGEMRGVRAMFWLKYRDVRGILDRYELYHPNNTIEGKIWEDNFNGDDVRSKPQ